MRFHFRGGKEAWAWWQRKAAGGATFGVTGSSSGDGLDDAPSPAGFQRWRSMADALQGRETQSPGGGPLAGGLSYLSGTHHSLTRMIDPINRVALTLVTNGHLYVEDPAQHTTRRLMTGASHLSMRCAATPILALCMTPTHGSAPDPGPTTQPTSARMGG